MAMELFEGDEAAARTWLLSPSKSLGGLSPLHAKLEDVSDLIGRIQHGVIS